MSIINLIEITDSDYRLIFSVGSAFFGAIIGGLITIWYKKKEVKILSDNLKLQSDNLELQKQNFIENSANNELKIKAELVRLEDLHRQYKLNLKKHDFEHLSKILDFAGDSNEKANMLKSFTNKLNDYKDTSYHLDAYEYEEYITNHVYYNLEFIETTINTLLKDYPNVFNYLHNDFTKVSSDANYLISLKSELFYNVEPGQEHLADDQILDQLRSSLLKLNDDFYNLTNLMKQEFKELDMIKKKYINSQFKDRVEDKNN